MAGNKIELTVVVAGVPTQIAGNLHAPLQALVEDALNESGNTGQPPANWEFKDQNGNLLDMNQNLGDLINAGIMLFLGLKAGVNG